MIEKLADKDRECKSFGAVASRTRFLSASSELPRDGIQAMGKAKANVPWLPFAGFLINESNLVCCLGV